MSATTVPLRALWSFVFAASIFVAAGSARAEAPLEPYPLDELGRSVPTTGRMRCPEVERVRYEGSALRWKTPLEVHPAFEKRLAAFEAIAVGVAEKIYGRAPTRIRHLGSYNCRRIRRYPDLLSEHGLGNAIDVAGFEFPALSARERKTSKLPKALQRAFSVTVLDHWDGKGADDSPNGLHRRFLHELTAALEAHPEVFRVMLGPAYPGHRNHFHFDCAPYRLVVL